MRTMRHILALGLCTTLLFACAKKELPPQAEKPDTALPVTAHKVGQHDLPETLLLPGRVVAQSEVQVSASLPGRVQEVLVNVGDTVSQGQLLARLETGQREESLQEARNSLAAMEAQYARLEQELRPQGTSPDLSRLQQTVKQRVTKLVQATQVQNLTSPDVLHDTGLELAHLQSDWLRLQNQTVPHDRLSAAGTPLLQSMQVQINQAHQAVQLAEAQKAAGQLTSPIDGVVLARNISDGGTAAPGVPLFSVGDLSRLEFEILVDPDQQTALAQGQTAQVQVGNLSPVQTRLTSVSPAPQPQTRSFTARTPLANPKRLYKPGMFGQATITLNAHPNVLAVPKAALLTSEDSTAPSVMKIGPDNRPTRTPVETGYDNGTWVEIRKGLTPGDRIILEGLHLLRPGHPVRVVRTVSGP